MRLRPKSRRFLATVVTGLVSAVVFGSQYVRQISIDPGPFREWAVAVLALTDSAQDQWLTTICVGVYFIALTLLCWRLAGSEHRSADLRIGGNSGVVDPAPIWKSVLRFVPESLLITFVFFAVAAYVLDYEKAYYFSDFLTLFAGVTFGRAVAVMRLWGKDGARPDRLHAMILPLLVLLLALAAVFHPDMGRVFRYREHVRWMGPYFNPNTFGLLMGMGLVLAVGQFVSGLKFKVQSPKPEERHLTPRGEEEHRTSNIEHPTSNSRIWPWAKAGLYLVAAILCGIGLIKSYSRGAWMGTAFGFAYLACAAIPLLCTSPRPCPQRGEGKMVSCGSCVSWFKRNGRPLVPGAILLVCSVLVLGFWNFRHTEHRVVRRVFSVGNPNDFSWRNRATASLGALQMMGDRPLLGFGWNQIEIFYTDAYRPPTLSESSAITLNDYSVLGVTLGLPALLCMFGYVAWKFGSGHRSYFMREGNISTTDWQMAVCRAGFVVLLLGFAVEKGIFYITLGVPFWILLELGAAVPRAANAKSGAQRSNYEASV